MVSLRNLGGNSEMREEGGGCLVTLMANVTQNQVGNKYSQFKAVHTFHQPKGRLGRAKLR